MHPILWQHPLISSYGAMIVLGAIVAWIVARWLARRVGVAPVRIDLLVPLLAATALIGAAWMGRIVDQVTSEPARASVLFGSLLLATAAGISFALTLRIPLGVLGDIMAAPVMIAVAFGRVGCFLAGCCYGRVCELPIAVSFPRGSFAYQDQLVHGLLAKGSAHALAVYPVQLFEAVLCAALGILLIFRFSRRVVNGELFLEMGAGYAMIRFCLEFFRGDNPAVAGPLTFSQVICFAVLATSAGIFLIRRRNAERWHLRPAGA